MDYIYNLIPQLPPQPDPLLQELPFAQRVRLAVIQAAVYVLAFIVAIAICALFAGCTTTRVVTVERVHADTVRITQAQRDSVFLHDSIRVVERVQGDTVRLTIDRWHTRYRDRLLTDTVYLSRVDTVPVTVPEASPAATRLTTWQRARLWLGNAFLGLLFCLTIFLYIKYLLRSSPPP